MALRPFGKKERPLILDVSQLARRVQWITGPDILMLRIYCQILNPNTPTATLVQPMAYNGEVFVTAIHDYDDHTPPPTVELPTINAAMIAHSLDWNKAPLKEPSANEGFRLFTALIFFNLRVIKREMVSPPVDNTYEIKVQLPASVRKTQPETLFIAYWNFGTLNYEAAKAFPLSIPVFYTQAMVDNNTPAISGNIQFFATSADRDFFISIQPDPWGATEDTTNIEKSDLFQWEVEAWTFKRRKEFPVDPDDFYAPTFEWEGDEKTKGHELIADGAYTDNMVLPARTVTIRANFKTLAMTMEKV